MGVTKEEVLEIIKNSLSIEISEYREQFIGDGIKVKLMLNGEEISYATVVTKYDWSYNGR